MRKCIAYLIFLMVTSGCMQEEKMDVIQKIDYSSFYLVDTSSFLLSYKNDSTTSEANYNPLSIGTIDDTVELIYNNFNRFEDYFVYLDAPFPTFSMPSLERIEIFVDTTKTIANVSPFAFIPPPEPNNLKKTRKKKGHYAYPVFVRNTTTDSVWIGYGDYIGLLVEAKDSLGEWKEIEKPYIYHCGTGLNDIVLPPNYLTVTSTIKYIGNYKTKLRVKTMNNYENEVYSNEFTGTINYSQLVKENKNRRK